MDTTTDARSSGSPTDPELRALVVGELIERLLHDGHEADNQDEATRTLALAYLLDQQLTILATIDKLNALYEQLAPFAKKLADGGIGGVIGLVGALKSQRD